MHAYNERVPLAVNIMLQEILANIKYRLGIIDREDLMKALTPDREAIIEMMPLGIQDNIRSLSDQMMDLKTLADPARFYDLAHRFQGQLELAKHQLETTVTVTGDVNVSKAAQHLGSADMLGYHAAGARLWKFFVNPMGVFTFLCENHWAIKAALGIIRTEIADEGIKYVYHPSVSPERLAQVDKQIRALNIEQLCIDLATGACGWGNQWVLPVKNLMQEVVELRIMQPDRIWPIIDEETEELLHWEYQVGHRTIQYSKEELFHLKEHSMRSRIIGTPPLSPCVVDLEADLSASALNNVIMNKAGMIGLIIALEDPTAQNPLNLKNVDKMAAKLQKTIQNQYSGIRGAQSVLVGNYIKAVHKVTDIGSFDMNFVKLRMEIAKTVAVLLQVPPEKMAIARSDAIQYQSALVEDQINASFDKAINALNKRVHRFVNEFILKKTLGIHDIEIAARGRFSSLTINSARSALAASQCGPLFTVNEMRTYFFKVPELPHDDPRGRTVCDNSTMRDPMLNKPLTATEDPRELLSLRDTNDLQDPDDESDDDPPAAAAVPAKKKR